jgi:NAD(P)-dependent dehydrogenase (short-subunit alcohol dehydrogenase family)
MMDREMDLGLKDKLAVVTGASKGIGLAITRALVAEGARVVAGSRHTSPELDALVDGGRVNAFAVDLSTTDGPQQLIDAARERGQINILTNNAGAVKPRLDGFLAVSDADWLAEFNLTFMAAVRTTPPRYRTCSRPGTARSSTSARSTRSLPTQR